MSKPILKLDWCSYAAAKFAVENWHYSKCMPAGKRVQIGVWESGHFVGAIIYGTGACPQIADPFSISRQSAAELVRVALRQHAAPVSRIIAISLKMLKAIAPKLRIIVSYADPEQGHHGGIYQAGNWVFCGQTKPIEWFIDTRTEQRIHTKTLKTGHRGLATRLKAEGKIRSIHLVKLKYLMPLDAEMRERIKPLAKPYPKRVTSIDSDAVNIQLTEGGATPTVTLQT